MEEIIPEFMLRPFRPSDAESLTEQANDEAIAGNMTDGFPHPYTLEHAGRFIQMANEDDPVHIFAIEVQGKAVGGIGIHPQKDIYRKNAELGYWIGKAYQDRGIISAAIPRMLDYAFSNFDLDRVFARPFGRNLASRRVLEKSGFTLEARLEGTIWKNGRYEDELIYAFRRP